MSAAQGRTDPSPPSIGILLVAGDGTDEEDGDRLESWVRDQGCRLAARSTVAPSREEVVRALLALTDGEGCDVVLTFGGVGLGEADVVPEATRAVLERRLPGVAGRIRGRDEADRAAALERGVAGVRGRTLVANLPAPSAGAVEGLEAVAPLVDRAVAELRGTAGREEAGPDGG